MSAGGQMERNAGTHKDNVGTLGEKKFNRKAFLIYVQRSSLLDILYSLFDGSALTEIGMHSAIF